MLLVSNAITLALALAASAPLPDAGTLVPAPEPFSSQTADPLLVPAPRAKRELASWDEAQQLLKASSTDERSAAAGVQRAQGEWRQSLGVLLPNARITINGLYDVLNPDSPPLAGAGSLPEGQRATVPLGTASLTASQTLIDLSAWRGLGSANAGRNRAEASLLDVRRRVTQGLARSRWWRPNGWPSSTGLA
jgi:outer membrane protein TolC